MRCNSKKTDYFCFLGVNPLDDSGGEFTVEQLLREWDNEAIEVGYVSPLPAFYVRDAMRANQLFLEKMPISNPRLRPAPMLDLSLGTYETDIKTFAQRGIQAIRLAPNFHGCPITGQLAESFIRVLNKHGLDLLIASELEDPRFQPECLKIASLTLEQIMPLAACPLQGRVICNNFDPAWVEAAIRQLPANFYFDVAGFGKSAMAMEKLVEAAGTERLVFGSGRPVFYPHAAKDTLLNALMPARHVDEIIRGLPDNAP